MWSNHSTAPLNCVYFGYAVGALFSIFIVRLFGENNFLNDHNNKKDLNLTIIIKEENIQSELIGPYLIASIFCLITSIGFALIAYKQKQYKKIHQLELVVKEEINVQLKSKRLFNKSKFWKICSPTTCGQGYLVYGFILIFLLVLYNFFFGGIEQGFTKFLISFVEKENLNLNKKDAVYSMIFYWLPMLIGRILCTFLTALWISPDLLLTISLFLCVLTYLLWILFLWYIGLTRLSVFILVTANGLSISSISPTTIGWIKQFLSLSPIELSLILSSNAIGGIVFGLICGYVFEHNGSKHLFTVLTICILLCFISFLLAFILQRIHSKRENKNEIIIGQEDKILETFLQNLDNDDEDQIFSSDYYQTIEHTNK